MNLEKLKIIVGHALVGWALSVAILAFGFAIMPPVDALLLHAMAVPIIFIYVSMHYFENYFYTTALQTAAIFTLTVMGMDFIVFGLLIDHTFSMFGSVLMTWIPFFMTFTATHMTGLYTLIMPRRRLFAR